MNKFYVLVGSNINPHENVNKGLDLIKKKITNPVGSDFLFLSLDAWVTQFEGEIPFQVIVEVMRDYVEISDDYGLTK